jgi:hypothetical protein
LFWYLVGILWSYDVSVIVEIVADGGTVCIENKSKAMGDIIAREVYNHAEAVRFLFIK